MQISSLYRCNNIQFKGHEAKRLDALIVQNRRHCPDVIFEQLNNIAMQHKLRIVRDQKGSQTWLQDLLVVTPDKKAFGYLSDSEYLASACEFEPLNEDNILNHKYNASEGGNIFYVTNKDGEQVLIYSKDSLTDSLMGLEKEFNVSKIIELPKVDYHTDLFITPIGDNKILVANDTMMIAEIIKMSEKISAFIDQFPNDVDVPKLKEIQKNILQLGVEFNQNRKNFSNKGAEEIVAQKLRNEGFEIIEVPSRLYECNPNTSEILRNRKLNYSNAVTFKNDNNEVVYIAGKSHIDDEMGITEEISKKVGIGFEKAFRDSISAHIKPENIYFINGSDKEPLSDVLYKYDGGLHCMCVEVPAKEE